MLASWPISKSITPSPAASASPVAFSPSLSDSSSFEMPPLNLVQRAHTFSSWLDPLHVHTTILVQRTQRVSCRAFRREPCTINVIPAHTQCLHTAARNLSASKLTEQWQKQRLLSVTYSLMGSLAQQFRTGHTLFAESLLDNSCYPSSWQFWGNDH